MVKIEVSTNNPDNYFKINGLDYERDLFTVFYSNVLRDGNNEVIEKELRVGLVDKKTRFVLQQPTVITNYINSTNIPYTTLSGLLVDLLALITKPIIV